MYFRLICFSVVILVFTSASHAGMSVASTSTTPLSAPVARTIASAPMASPVLSMADNAVAAKASKTSARQSWVLSLPKGAGDLCMAGICLGDSVDELPLKSANAGGSRVSGDWLQALDSEYPEQELSQQASRKERLRAFEDMRDASQVCAISSLTAPLKTRMHLVFMPQDSSPGGIEVIAELIPKKRYNTKSSYAVTQIQMNVRRGDGDEASVWPQSIASMWPALKPMQISATTILPERIVMWATTEAHAKGGLSSIASNTAYYSVSPMLSDEDMQFNFAQWDDKPVTHKLQWGHGVYGLELATPSQIRAVDAALHKQEGCETYEAPAAPKKAQSKIFDLTN